MSGPVSSAFISEAVSRITSLLTGKYSKHSNVQEWIDRLVMAQIQIESALLESEESDINNDEPLHKWQEKLKEALCEAEEVLSNFQAEILHEEPNQTIEGGHTASNLGEAVTRQVDLEANLPNDPFMQEEGSDDATLVHTASNLTEAITRQVDLEANLPHDPFMQEEGSDDATLVHTASILTEVITRLVNLQAGLFPGIPIILIKAVKAVIRTEVMYKTLLRVNINQLSTSSDLPLKRSNMPSWIYPCKKWLGEYLENDKNVSKLKNTVEKLEKMAGNIGNFIKLLELQKKRKMSRKRKRSGVALLGFFLVISLKLQTYALFCYREDPYLLVIRLFRANCDIPTAITGDIFIGFIM